MLPPAFFLYVFLFCSLLLHCLAGDSLTRNSPIRDSRGETLVSNGEKFELGFFTPNGSTERRYVGIWFYRSSPRTVVDIQEEYDGGRDLHVRVSVSDTESAATACGTCGTNMIPYPLSTGPKCGDPAYLNFYCNLSSGQLNFKARGDTYRVTKINPGTHTFVIQTETADSDDIYVTYSASENSAILRVTLVPDGRIELLLWQEINNDWLSMWQWPSTYCEFYAQCSPFSSCDPKGSQDHCKCLPGFQPKVQQEWDTRNWTGGTCVRQKALRCDKDDGFLELVNMKLPDHSYILGNMSTNDCESRCLRNCSCTAYAYLNASDGASGKCLNWYGDLMDLVQDFVGSDLYIRLHDGDPVGNVKSSVKFTRKNKRSIIIAVAAVSIGLAWEMWNDDRGLDLIDLSIRDTSECPERALKCIHVGLLCVQESPVDRPAMPLVVLMLGNDNASLPSPEEPAFSSIKRRKSSNVASSSSSDHNTLSSCSNNELTITLPQAR
ncbi:hypothetical protein NC652_031906 [Populus alba x Populus x berolinensis]|nr:hypothetical protein NC652_031906 [Populus alba x Populus x berolinensis]